MVGTFKLGGVGVHHGVTFNFTSTKVCAPAILETCFSCDKDILIAATDYCIPGQTSGILRIQYGHAATAAAAVFISDAIT